MIRFKTDLPYVENYKIIPKVLPCPFCGNDEGLELWSYFVFCPTCHCKGPAMDNKASAINMWNWRGDVTKFT